MTRFWPLLSLRSRLPSIQGWGCSLRARALLSQGQECRVMEPVEQRKKGAPAQGREEALGRLQGSHRR